MNCPQLVTLSSIHQFLGLNYLYLRENEALTSLGWMASERSELLSVLIYDCDSFVSLNSFGAMPSLGRLDFFDCDGLESLAGAGLPSVIDWVSIFYCEQIQDLDGLQGLEEVSRRLYISDNPLLQDFGGLESLRSVEEIVVTGNTSLGNQTVFDFLSDLDYWGTAEVGGNDP